MTDPMPRKDVELPPRIPEAAIIAELRAELAQARADAQAAVALVVEQATGIATRHWEGEPEDTIAMEADIRSLADADALAAANAVLEAKVAGLVEALEDIASAQRFPSHGDPVVLRDRARAALATQEAGNG